MSDGVFTATMSYHQMLKRAQELDPVLTYVVCKLLSEAKEKRDREFVESERINVSHHKHPFSIFFMLNDMEQFLTTIFQRMTIRLDSAVLGEDDWTYRTISARREFVRWLKEISLSFDDERRFVTIPA